MCGICGLIFRDPRNRPSRDVLRRMTATLRHRGPDDSGVELLENAALGHTRLSILDLSPAGHQPMSNEDGTVWITFNGEIYNFEELRRELSHKHQFRSHCDTEVLVHLYEEHGEGMVDRIDGMFAFAIVDLKQQRVVLARDPFGIKPLFYAMDERRLVFGSELKALLASGEVAREIDLEALNDYFDFLWIPAPRTIFKTVHKLLPAHTLTLDLQTWKSKTRRYWQPTYCPEEGRNLQTWIDESEAVLSQSVRRHMVSDVPVGAFLSGGIDSSLVSYYASQHSAGPLRTFTIGFEEGEFSEVAFAQEVANKVRAEAVVRTVHAESIEQLFRIAEFYDEPMADTSLLPTYAVSQVAREHLKVALSGDGGDEMFSGYTHHAMANQVSRLDVLPHFVHKAVFGSLARISPVTWRMHEWSRRFALPADERRLSITRLPGRRSQRELLSPEIRTPLVDRFWHMRKYLPELRGLPPVTQMQFYDLLFFLPNDMLVKVDRASMAHSLEVRVPFLCRAVAELAFRIPETVRFGNGKQILRALVSRHFGEALARRPKQGFGIPLQQWMRDLAGGSKCEELLESSVVRSSGLLDVSGVRRMIRSVAEGGGRLQVNRSEELFAVFVFVAWWEKYMQTTTASSSVSSS
ncbi:MAG: asparagine synthase (glutamine-hydrolyzing) [Pirellulales bacterium]|nr:asparagine synthase (glutamine-hydrolyzing) [Pirellulales bacterium]